MEIDKKNRGNKIGKFRFNSGLSLIAIGLFGLAFALKLDTTILTADLSRVNNLGLIADRQNYLTISGLLVLIGVILYVFRVGNTQNISDDDRIACPFCAERIMREAKICRFCNKDIPIAIDVTKTELAEASASVAEVQPLIQSVKSGDIEACKRIIDDFIDINARDEKGATALIHAVLNTNEEIVNLLMSHHADPNIATHKGLLPITIAKRNNLKSIQRMLTTKL